MRSTDINRPEFEGISGDWNSASGPFIKDGYMRGKTVLNTKATQQIKCNSDWFSTDDQAAWIEELFISNSVYLLSEYDVTDTGGGGAAYGKYAIPVMIESKKYERYTEANDKVAQYELDISYAYNKRIQTA